MLIKQIKESTFWKGEKGLSAEVGGDDGQYQVQLYVKDKKVREYRCSCPEGSSYLGMCRHSRFVWETWNKQEKRQNDNQSMIFTSSQARVMIREFTNREVAKIETQSQEQAISLTPFLAVKESSGEVRAQFWLGSNSGSYAIKDLGQFAQAMSQGTYVEYGKNLAFYHCLPAFDQESRVLAAYLLELIGSRPHLPPLGKELVLSKHSIDRMFALLLGREIDITVGGKGKQKVKLRDQNPLFPVEAEKKGAGGIALTLLKTGFFLFGESFLYVLQGDNLYRCDADCTKTMGVFIRQMLEIPNYRLLVSGRDMPLFYERVIKLVSPYCSFRGEELNWEEFAPVPLSAEFLFETRGTAEIMLKPTLSYGDYSFHPLEDEHIPRTICRDVPGEFCISKLITKYFKHKDPEGAYFVIRGDDQAIYHLLSEGIDEFLQAGKVFLPEAVQKWKISEMPKVGLSVSVKADWLRLELDPGPLSPAELAAVLGAYEEKKKYVRLPGGGFLRLTDEGLLPLSQLKTAAALDKADFARGEIRLPAFRSFYLDELLKNNSGITYYRDRLFKAMIRGMKHIEDSDTAVPKGLAGVLRGYQEYGFRWLKTLSAAGFGGILADDMGLGKTLQVIALLAWEYLEGNGSSRAGAAALPTLIICPSSLVYNWENEFRKFAPEMKVCKVIGNAVQRKEVLAEAKNQKPHVFLTSYELLKRDREIYQEMEFLYQVIDEAQLIKNAATQSAKTVKSMKAKTKFALTGTPVENYLSELWSIFDYLMPGFLFTYRKFRTNFELPIVKEKDVQVLNHLKKLTGAFILRRVKQDVLKELPDKMETIVFAQMEETQKKLYLANALALKKELEGSSGADYSSKKIHVLAQLTRLRQICCQPRLCYENYHGESAKLNICMELIESGVSGGHKILLFSQFTTMLEAIKSELKKREISFFMLTGATSKEERAKLVENFQSGQAQIFLISLKAGGTGLNLTAADMVIHYDPWWNQAVENQASDRAHRIGQDKQVMVYKLIAKDTIEENILSLQAAKKNLADQMITAGSISFGELNKEDILGLLATEDERNAQ